MSGSEPSSPPAMPLTLQSLIGKGYLQNLRIDSENRTVGLYIPEGALVQWVCASCGAKNRARRGGPCAANTATNRAGNDGILGLRPHRQIRRRPLALSFPPPAACGFLVLHPIGLRNLHLHSTKKNRHPVAAFACLNDLTKGSAAECTRRERNHFE